MRCLGISRCIIIHFCGVRLNIIQCRFTFLESLHCLHHYFYKDTWKGPLKEKVRQLNQGNASKAASPAILCLEFWRCFSQDTPINSIQLQNNPAENTEFQCTHGDHCINVQISFHFSLCSLVFFVQPPHRHVSNFPFNFEESNRFLNFVGNVTFSKDKTPILSPRWHCLVPRKTPVCCFSFHCNLRFAIISKIAK